MDREFADRRRGARADPEDHGAQERVCAERSRREGPGVFLELLADRAAWNGASPAMQDAAIAATAATLTPAFELAAVRIYECGGASHRVATFRHRATNISFNLIPGGLPGNAAQEAPSATAPRSSPTAPFLMARTPLTQAEWSRVAIANPSSYRGADLPVETVSWNDAQDWLRRAGDALRLPSEAEWEYACRAGTQTDYFWGGGPGDEAMDPSYCWHDANCHFIAERERGTRPVTAHEGRWNAFGLIDMLGNVGEWCEDAWHPEPGAGLAGPERNRASFGRGAWFQDARVCRASFRGRHEPRERGRGLGFRVARSLA